MNSKIRDPRFYVVGGAVQPGRPCYMHRVADAELYRRASEGDYTHVLAQRQAGKTSLAAATVAKLRAAGLLVSLVDLTQASSEDPSENAGRWFYSIAYRIVRDLRIKTDLQTWWVERSGLTNLQRLREFFDEIVLQETDQKIAIFFDRVEATIDEPIAQDLFAAIRACYDARVSDSDFDRLSVCMLGSADPNEIVTEVQGSLFEISYPIELPDFSPQEMANLLAGLGDPLPEAEAIAARVWSWTRGHPYISQKVYRSLARRKNVDISASTVDELVQVQFLSTNTLTEEPHLLAVAERLLQQDSGRALRLNLYGRIRKGVRVMANSASETQQELLTIGLIAEDSGGELRVRNEVYAMVFDTRWVNQNLPYGVKGLGVAAVIIACVIALPVWYAQFLPRPYVRALSAVNQDYQVAEDAYSSLTRLPGYKRTADRLFMSFLDRYVRQVGTLSEFNLAALRMRALPGGVDRADQLIGDFWERRALQLMHTGDRDSAIVSLMESLNDTDSVRRRIAAELIGDDYRFLIGTLHAKSALREYAVDESSELVTILDVQNNIDRWSLSQDTPRRLQSAQLVAEESVNLRQRRNFSGLSGNLGFLINITHARPEQVDLVLRAPSGLEAIVSLAEGEKLTNDFYRFSFSRNPLLREILRSELNGNWSLTLSDSQRGVSGELLGWAVVPEGGRDISSDNRQAQPVPEPRVSPNAVARLSANGRMALTWPADSAVKGDILIWDLANDVVQTRIAKSAEQIDARLALQGKRLLTIEPRRIQIWDADSGKNLGQIDVDAGIPSELNLSSNERYAAIRVLRKDGKLAVAVWDLQTLRMIGKPIAALNVTAVAVDADGRMLAVGGQDTWVRIWSLNSGKLLRELSHSAPLRSLQFDAKGSWLASDDLSSTFRLWDIAKGGRPLVERRGNGPWYADFAGDSASLLYGSFDRAYEVVYLPAGRRANVRLRHPVANEINASIDASPEPRILAGRDIAVTTDANNDLKIWKLPIATERSKQRVKSLPGGSRSAVSADGQRIAVGATPETVMIYAVGAPGGILLGKSEAAQFSKASVDLVCLEFSGDRQLLAGGAMDGRARVWNTQSGALLDFDVVHPDGPVLDVLFTTDVERLISASRNEVLLSSLEDGATLARLRIQADNPQLAYAAESDAIYVADDQGGVTLWNWRTGYSERIIPGNVKARKIAVDAAGEKIIVANSDGQLSVWDLSTRSQLELVTGAAARVDNLWISKDGRQLFVQAGHWLQSMAVFPTGLAPRYTRLFAAAPAAVRPNQDERTVFVLAPSATRPVLMQVDLAMPPKRLLEGDPASLREYWRQRLALNLDGEGWAIPLRDTVPTGTSFQ